MSTEPLPGEHRPCVYLRLRAVTPRGHRPSTRKPALSIMGTLVSETAHAITVEVTSRDDWSGRETTRTVELDKSRVLDRRDYPSAGYPAAGA
jgi:hypothetical protein